MSEQCRSQMPTGGGAHDADTFAVQFPFGSFRPYGANGAGSILQHRRVMIASRAKPVFQHETSDALLVQKTRIVVPFMVGQARIAATGTDDHRGAGSFFR